MLGHIFVYNNAVSSWNEFNSLRKKLSLRLFRLSERKFKEYGAFKKL